MKNWIDSIKGKKSVVSFSGGKDSTLALYKAMEVGEVVLIIVMMEANGEKSRAHSIFPELLKAQALAMGVPLIFGSASFEDYEKVFIEKIEEAKKLGAEVLVTGDIDMPEHGCWYEKIANKVGLDLGMPLWNRSHKEVVKEFIDLGFKTKLVTINKNMRMKREDLGKILNKEYIKVLEERDIDICAERGEFHTLVIDGPIFKKEIKVKEIEVVASNEYEYLILGLAK